MSQDTAKLNEYLDPSVKALIDAHIVFVSSVRGSARETEALDRRDEVLRTMPRSAKTQAALLARAIERLVS